jgi:hypothetical protein
MRRHLGFQQSHELRAPGFTQVMQGKTLALAWMHGGVALHIGQREGALAIAAVGGTKQREEGGVLRNRQDLPVTKRPAFGRELERKYSDFSYEWIGHK